MTDDATVEAGRAAWQRIKEGAQTSFESWLAIGRALLIARRECMARAKCNSPYGKGYAKEMRAWLDSNGLGDVENKERQGALYMVEHQADIEAWRDGLSDEQRRRCNHPNTILKHLQGGTVPQKRGPKPQIHHRAELYASGKKGTHGKPIDWPRAEHIRRAAKALGESYGRDLFVMASAALRAALRDEDDVLELLNPAPAKDRAHAQTMGPASDHESLVQ
jgi:hypothetical protein